MDEFGNYMMDWDLEAIVRGGSSTATTTSSIIDDPIVDFSELFCEQEEEEEVLIGNNFAEFAETTRVLDDLEEFYKPFYPVLHSQNTILPMITKEPQQLDLESEKVAVQDLQVVAPLLVTKCKKSIISGKKKKKSSSVVKKEVRGEDGLIGIDEWGWRKYGQKPIKGSPYPRSYYRCSTCKGCLARKQVERSHLDPGVFLVTYTAEHTHPHPTRRNSLAAAGRKITNTE